MSEAKRIKLERKIVPILAESETSSTIEISDFWALEVSNPKEISKLISKLTESHPLNHFAHLKRVKTLKREDTPTAHLVLLEPKLDDAKPELENCIADYSILTVTVPKTSPQTKAQFVKCLEVWPTIFHQNLELEALLAGTFFTETQTSKIFEFAENVQALQASISQNFGESENVCIITDWNGVFAQAADCRTEHPLQHAAMRAIDLIAKSQGGGAWNLSDGDIPCPPSDSQQKAGSYLCTNYNAFLAREPCLMCAGALLHSRIANVFFLHDNADQGALVSRLQLHLRPGLNHYYRVFKMVL